MNARDNDTVRRRNAGAIAIRKHEGEPGRDSVDHQYGRRIEMDRSWTVYHVFTGVPVCADGHAMTGLSRSDATSGMLSLNLRNTEGRLGRITLPSRASSTPEATQRQP